MTDNQPVVSILARYGSATFELAFLALIVALVVGIGLGQSPPAGATMPLTPASVPSPSCATPPRCSSLA